MSSSYLEQLRSSLSSVEVMEKTIVYCLFGRNTLPQHQVLLEHRINNLLQMAQRQAQDSITLLEGSDGWKKEELDALQGLNRKDGDMWDSFYERYKEIKDYHRKISQGHTMPQISTNKVEYFFDQAFEPPFKEPFFSGEESNGRYLDLHANYQEFLNLKKLKESEEYKIGDYLWYLQNFDLFHDIPQNLKEKERRKYMKYLQNLFEYIKGFYGRVNPLTDIRKVQQSFEDNFETQWKSGLVRGWEKRFQSSEEIQSNPLYCRACTKLFQNENTFIHHFQGKKHKMMQKIKEKDMKVQDKQEIDDEEKEDEDIDITLKQHKKIAFLESMISSYKENLNQIVNDTMNLVRKNQSRGYDEGDGEFDGVDAVNNVEENQSDEESPIYNPKNLPLGWDGRPIPYWLYKLHGLGIEYKCEICGNTSYWGRKAFEDHFQGWRHSYGMRCLRIPNSLHFKEITRIQDAINLHQRLQVLQQQNRFRPDYEEEYEDAEGNLLNKKTFYDLRKQGMA